MVKKKNSIQEKKIKELDPEIKMTEINTKGQEGSRSLDLSMTKKWNFFQKSTENRIKLYEFNLIHQTLKCSVQNKIYSICQLLMVFLKPNEIKVGFFLVAGSQDQVQRRTQRAESLQAGEVIPSSLPETGQTSGSRSWAAENRRAMCRRLHEPPKEKGREKGQR